MVVGVGYVNPRCSRCSQRETPIDDPLVGATIGRPFFAQKKPRESLGGMVGFGVDELCAAKGVPRRELESVGGSRRGQMKQSEESAAVERNQAQSRQ